jgi:3D (Asp-Asp-Asp) domain-containing protein
VKLPQVKPQATLPQATKTPAPPAPKPTPPPIPQPKAESPKQDDSQYVVYNVTAYTNGVEDTQKHKGQEGYGITASGKKTVEGVTIAAPKSIPFGTKIYIKELDHTYIVQDRGGAIKSGHLDVFFDNVSDMENFGRQYLHIKIIKE